MKALLLAAGLGTRLWPLTKDTPKCLVEINGRPILDYWIRMLCGEGVHPLLVNLHHCADQVRVFIRSHEYKEHVCTVYEEKLLGTAGTLFKNRSFFNNAPLMFVHADNLSRFDVKAFINRHAGRPSGCEITMMTFKAPAPQACGIVELDERGVVQAFHEKVENPPGYLANGAVYILEPSIFDYLESLDKEFIDFSTEVIPHYMGRIFTFHNDIYHRDIGTLESLEAARKEFSEV